MRDREGGKAMYTIVMVDDDLVSLMQIKKVITESCPDFGVIGLSCNINEGMRLIAELNPDLIMMNVKWLISQAPFETGCLSIALIGVYQEIDDFRSIFQTEDVKCVIGKPVQPKEVQDAILKVSLVIKSRRFIESRQAFSDSTEKILEDIEQENTLEMPPDLIKCLSCLKKVTTDVLEYSKEMYRFLCLMHNAIVQKKITAIETTSSPTYNRLSLSNNLNEVDQIVFDYCDFVISLLLKSKCNYHPIIHEVLIEINRNYQKPLTLDTLGAKFYLNRTYLCQIFKQEVGISFVEYLTNVRIKKAKQLLKAGDSIAIVGEKVGYNNYRYFSQVFKKKEGFPPSKYRKYWTKTMTKGSNNF